MEKTDGCWVWRGYRNRFGYGQIGLGRTEEGIALTHRVAYELTFGPIPDGLFVCHHCDNPPCVNPDHLFLGTPADNMRDAASKGRAKGAQGATNWNARLSTEDVQNIRLLDGLGVPRKETAQMFGITRQYVGEIARRDTRKVA